MITAERLKNKYIEWIKQSYEYSQLDNNVIRIDTPFVDNMSDGIVIYAIPNSNNTVTLTDDGWTLDNLKSRGVFINRSKHRKNLLEKQLKLYGITIDDEDLTISADIKKFAESKHRLLQAILFVNDMFMLSKHNATSIFLEDVDNYFVTNHIRVLRNASFIGNSGLTHKFEFSIAGFEDEVPYRLIKTMSSSSNTMFAKSIVTDVEQTRSSNNVEINTNFYVFINDFKDDKKINPNEEIISLFKNSEITPVLYSERDNFVAEFQK